MLDPTDKMIVNLFQNGFPLTPEPFSEIGEAVGITQVEALTRVRGMIDEGFFEGIELDYDSGSIGEIACLCALAVANARSEEVAAAVAGYPNASQFWVLDHTMSVWFILVAATEGDLDESCRQIEQACGSPILQIPITREFPVDFKVRL